MVSLYGGSEYLAELECSLFLLSAIRTYNIAHTYIYITYTIHMHTRMYYTYVYMYTCKCAQMHVRFKAAFVLAAPTNV